MGCEGKVNARECTSQWVQLVCCRGDNAKVLPGTSNGPEEIRVGGLRCFKDLARGHDNAGR